MRTGDVTPDGDTDAGPITDVDRGFVVAVTPSGVTRLADVIGEISDKHATGAFAFAPTPRVEVSTGIVRERAVTASRILGGRYRLGRQLGAGGYGAVFAAEDTITGDRVAIKVLSPAASRNRELIIRFHREAIAASRARHPHIVTVLDFDVDDDDEHFIVMEHLDGRDLAQTLTTTRPLALVRALKIAAQCARGLAAAHRVGVLHRDLKPANVFLAQRDDGEETVKVIDFGISKLTPLAGDYTDVTSGSKVVGTPSYMSPEQARGAVLDARTDVYALGVMLFEMLVGERPFSGRSPIEIIGNHVSAPRVAPSTLRAEVAACSGLDSVVLRALSPEPAQRFESMEAMGNALVECLRSIAPAEATHVTEPTDELSGRRRVIRRADSATSAITRVTPASRIRLGGAVVIAAGIVAACWLALVHGSATSTRREVAPSNSDVGATTARPATIAKALPPATPATAATSTPTVVAHEAPASRVVVITSTPRGAAVYRGANRLGVTPLTLAVDSTEQEEMVTIQAAGYRSRRVVVGADRDHVDVVLSAVRVPKPAPHPAPSVRGVGEW